MTMECRQTFLGMAELEGTQPGLYSMDWNLLVYKQGLFFYTVKITPFKWEAGNYQNYRIR